MEKRIELQKIYSEWQEFLAMPEGVKKNLAYSKKIQGVGCFVSSILKREDGTIHYSNTEYRVSKGKVYFLKKGKKRGFTVDPKGKMKIWFGHKLNELPVNDEFFKALKQEWFKIIYFNYVTPAVLGKVIAGKITNPTDLAKAILKAYRVKGSPAFFLLAINNHSGHFNKGLFLKGIKVAKNFDHFLLYFAENGAYNSSLFDMMDQAIILESKIDFNWSTRRIEEEHNNFTAQLMDLESEDLSDEPLEWIEDLNLNLPESCRLLKSQKEVYKEGRMMHHCVYTNYWNSVVSQSFIVVSVNYQGSNYTLGINHYKNSVTDKFEFNQLSGKCNNPSPLELREQMKNWIESLNFKPKTVAEWARVREEEWDKVTQGVSPY